jgi:hypothetical protein
VILLTRTVRRTKTMIHWLPRKSGATNETGPIPHKFKEIGVRKACIDTSLSIVWTFFLESGRQLLSGAYNSY